MTAGNDLQALHPVPGIFVCPIIQIVMDRDSVIYLYGEKEAP